VKEGMDVCSAAAPTTVLHGLPSLVLKSPFLLGFASLSTSLVVSSRTQLGCGTHVGTEPRVHPCPLGTLRRPHVERGVAGARESDLV